MAGCGGSYDPVCGHGMIFQPRATTGIRWTSTNIEETGTYKQGVGVYDLLSESDSTCLTIFALSDCFPPPLFQASSTGGQTQNATGTANKQVPHCAETHRAALIYLICFSACIQTDTTAGGVRQSQSQSQTQTQINQSFRQQSKQRSSLESAAN